MSWTVPKINIRVEKHGDGDWNGGAQDFQKKKKRTKVDYCL